MKKYAYGRIERLYNSLVEYGVSDDIINEIVQGGEAIKETTKPEKKAEWFQNSMNRMNRLLPENERLAVRENCACCLGGKRLQLSKQIAKKHDSLEERIAAANKTGYVFGNGVKQEGDGTLTVKFFQDNLPEYQCVCLRKVRDTISETYCYCCGGHIKHHLQVALGCKLSCKVISSALSSGGKKNCKFSYTIVE
ncbi:MAG: hypothetical protein A2Y21_06600 [Clostridiales bacterium GWC2_40_7]|nr:MAG: hypothetical protein A2Y21_06600 [Clostridiales bacterium GWC2_40_7]